MRLITLLFDIGVLASLGYSLDKLLQTLVRTTKKSYRFTFSFWTFGKIAVLVVALLGLVFLIGTWLTIIVIRVVYGL